MRAVKIVEVAEVRFPLPQEIGAIGLFFEGKAPNPYGLTQIPAPTRNWSFSFRSDPNGSNSIPADCRGRGARGGEDRRGGAPALARGACRNGSPKPDYELIRTELEPFLQKTG